ncbi:MAG: type VI secretion system tip protein TssI/VgrG [Planctomycetota bacterium]
MKFNNQVLSLHSDALPADTLMVSKLTGEERMSGLFRFELELICEDSELDLEAVLYAPARLGIKLMTALGGGRVGTSTREIAGVFEQFEQRERGNGWTRYHAVLVPKLWLTTRSSRSRVFQGVTIDALVTDVLTGDGLDPNLDFEFKLLRDGADGDPAERTIYPLREYVVQFEESDWQFLSRWLEHEGIYFYFENEDGAEKIVFADTESSFAKPMFGGTFTYNPEASGEGADPDKFVEEEVRTFVCRQTRLPKTVTVNDYNWRIPSRVTWTEDVLEHGTGLQTEYNDHFKTGEQGHALAQARADELKCRARVFHGTGSCRSFRPGATFTLEGHYRGEWNRSYLLVSVTHTAEQMISLESATITGAKYTNTFEAVYDDQAWRPACVTPWPAIKGVIHATIDSEGQGKYAQLDQHGRYKVKLPFDEYFDPREDGERAGKASRWIRMAQPYAGARAGMHFPLAKGTEVLLVHIDGDPDRPIITGAVPNPMNESPANESNASHNAIRTRSGNAMNLDDSEYATGFSMRDGHGSMISEMRRPKIPKNGGGGGPGGGSGNVQSTPRAAGPGALPGGGHGSALPPGQAGQTTSGSNDPDVLTDASKLTGFEAYTTFVSADPTDSYYTAVEEISQLGCYRFQVENELQSPTGAAPGALKLSSPPLDDPRFDSRGLQEALGSLYRLAEDISSGSASRSRGTGAYAFEDVDQFNNRQSVAIGKAGFGNRTDTTLKDARDTAQDELDTAQAALDAAEATLETAEEDLATANGGGSANEIAAATAAVTQATIAVANATVERDAKRVARDAAQQLLDEENVALLIANANQFSGEAFGSRVRAWLGDSVTIDSGNKYTYSDIGNDIKLSGGDGFSFSHSEGSSWGVSVRVGNDDSHSRVRGNTTSTSYVSGNSSSTSTTDGDSTSDSTTRGNSTSTSFTHGQQHSKSYTFGTSDSVAVNGSANTANSVDLGVFNANSFFLGARGGLAIMIAGELNISISAAVKMKVDINAAINFDFDLSPERFTVDMVETKIALQKKEAALQKTAAKLASTDNELSRVTNRLSENQNKLADNTNALQQGVKSLSQQTMVLAGDDKRVMNNITSAMTKMTNGVTMI